MSRSMTRKKCSMPIKKGSMPMMACFKLKKSKKPRSAAPARMMDRDSYSMEGGGTEKQEEVVEDMVLYLAQHQNINGSWTNDESILTKLGIDCSKVKNGKPEGISDEVWMTVIIYEYLHVKLTDREKEWRLFAKKAKQWLTKSVHDTPTLDKILEHGRGLMG